MQQVKEFMQDLFLARIAEQREILDARVIYRQKFFTPDCHWDSHEGVLEMLRSEKIVNIDEQASAATVVASYNIPFHPSGARTQRRRYHLRAAGEKWLIWCVEEECPVCRGQGDENCTYCKGKHWL